MTSPSKRSLPSGRLDPLFESPVKRGRVPSLSSSLVPGATQEEKELSTPALVNAIVTPVQHQENAQEQSAMAVATAAQKRDDISSSLASARRKLPFGRDLATAITKIKVSTNVRLVYKIVRKITGSVGGNGSFGAIYGELTIGSMQKMINLMKEHCEFTSSSKFIDVGSGIGKPNLHVMQDPGVEFSYGIEMERSRWVLGLASLKAVLTEAQKPNSTLLHKCMFDHGNIKQAKTFDPFTHVYMFSIGFPPSLWEHLSDMFNNSSSPYLICYHSPRIIVDRYDFDVELITQTPTSMHGSSEGHSGYLYRRKKINSTAKRTTTPIKNYKIHEAKCDTVYRTAFDLVHSGLESLHESVVQQVQKEVYGKRVTRARKLVHCIESDNSDADDDSREAC